MARNIFASSPLDNEINRQAEAAQPRSVMDGVKIPGTPPQAPDTGPVDFHDIARETQVPYNVIEALTKASGITSDAERSKFAREAASRIGNEMKGGADVKTALHKILGDDAPVQDLLDEARKLAPSNPAETAPDTTEPEEGGFGTGVKHFGQNVANAAVDMVATVPEAAAINRAKTQDTDAQLNDRWATDAQSIFADALADPNMSEADKQALRDKQDQLSKDFQGEADKTRSDIRSATESDMFKAGDRIRDGAKSVIGEAPPSDGWSAAIAQGFGSTAGFALAGLAAEAIGGPVAGTASIAALGSAANGVGAYKEAKAKGATEEQAMQVYGFNALVGTSEALPIATALKMIKNPILRRKLSKRVFDYFAHVGVNMGEEAVQEGGQQLMQNLIAKGIYDPERNVFEDVPENALIGAITGGIISGAGGLRRSPEERALARKEKAEKKRVQVSDPGAPNDGEILTVAPDQPDPSMTYVERPDGETVPIGNDLLKPVDDEFQPIDYSDDPSLAADQEFLDQPAKMKDATQAAPGEQIPSGPLGRAAALAPDVQSAGAAEGQFVTISAPGAADFSAQFVGEDSNGINLKYEGGPLHIPRSEIEDGAVTIIPQNVAEQKATHDAAKAKTKTVSPQDDAIGSEIDQLTSHLTTPFSDQERADAITRVQNGADPLDAVHDTIMETMRSLTSKSLDEQRDTSNDVPFGDPARQEDAPQPATEQKAEKEPDQEPIKKDQPIKQDVATTPVPEVKDTVLADAVSAGEVAHTTKRGKELTGYILRGVPKAHANEIDKYSFKKDGGWFVRKDDLAKAHPDLMGDTAAPESDTAAPQPAPEQAKKIDEAAAEAHPDPTDGQKEAGNYKMGHTAWNGESLTFENAKGSERKGTGPDGKAWSVKMPAHYGYFKGTEGADGDHIDFYMGDKPDSDYVMIVDQADEKTGKFDEHKVIIGTPNREAALKVYRGGFSDGKADHRLGGFLETNVAGLKDWLNPGSDQEAFKRPASGELSFPFKKAKPAADMGQSVDETADQGANEPDQVAEQNPLNPQPHGPRRLDWWWTNASKADRKAALRGAELDESLSSKLSGELHGAIRSDPEAWHRLTQSVFGPEAPPKPKTKPKRQNAKAARAARMERLRDYFSPGNIVHAYGGSADRVISFDEGKDGDWSVKVESVVKDGAGWKKNPADDRIRTHRTEPDARELKAGPLERAAPAPAPEADPEPQAENKSNWGASNTLVSVDRAAEIRAKLAGKLRNQLNSGVDPEILALGTELAAFHMEAGARKFLDLANAIARDLSTTPAKLRPYLRAWYNGARDMMEDHGVDIAGMDGPDAVAKQVKEIAAQGETTAPTAKSAPQKPTEGENTKARRDIDENAGRPDVSEDGKLDPNEKGQTDEQRGDQARDQGALAGRGAGSRLDAKRQPDGGSRDDGRGEGNENRAPRAPGDDAPRGVGDGSSDLSGTVAREPEQPATENFVITDDFPLGEGTEGKKLEANLAALRLLRQLDSEKRQATPDEQAVLARWVGWGGLKTVFDGKHKGKTNQWGRAQAELRSLLTSDEYYAAMRSTNDAHYTSRPVIKAMWRAMRNFGFEKGRALEPTIGSGNFLGLQPADMARGTEWYAAELDPITSAIAKQLYPQATIYGDTGFQDAPLRAGAFDVAIGNPPFGSTQIKSDMHPDLGSMKVHNYIIAKTGQLLREGGVMGMVVTHRFLDNANAEARSKLAPKFRFLGAVRLPNTAFLDNANTSVVTDIVFFQRRAEGDSAGDTSWLKVDQDGPNGTKLNGYFAKNPEMILGRAAMDGEMYANRVKPGEERREFTVHPDGRDLEASLTDAIDSIKATLPTREQALEDAATAPATSSSLAYGEMALDDSGKVMRGESDPMGGRFVEEITPDTFWRDQAEASADLIGAIDALREMAKSGADIANARQEALNHAQSAGVVDLAGDPLPQKTKFMQALADELPNLLSSDDLSPGAAAALDTFRTRVEAKRLGRDGFDRLSAILNLRQKVKALIRAERNDHPDMETLRADLNKGYRRFKTKYGFLNSSKNEAILRGDVGAEMALELNYKPARDGREESARPAPILSKRVIYPHKLPTNVASAADGLHISMQERGYIDPGFIASLANSDVESVVSELTSGANPLIFRNPATDRYELAEVYLSGNLAEKIQQAEDAGLRQQIPHLKAAMPPPKTADQVTPSIRSMWMPPSVYQQFLSALGYSSPKVGIYQNAGIATVNYSGYAANDFGRQFSTDRMEPGKIFEAAIKGKAPVIYDTVRDEKGEKRVKNADATREAVTAYERIGDEFPKWAMANPERAQTILDAFNEKVNVVTERKYDGVRYLRTVGASPEISLRNSQKNGAWRMIQDPVTLLHHVVGAGKTFTAITGIMERKRMGLTNKAVVGVPNHLTGQWGKEWLEMYPAANILVPTEKDFEPANRAKLINRIATGDFDAVIIGHSQLVKIENDDTVTKDYIAEQLEELEAAMQAAKENGDSRRTVGQMGQRISTLQDKLKRLDEKAAARADSNIIPWHELGVDYLALDEAQEFKNLEYSTTASQLVGMNPPAGSERAFDLLMKVRSLQTMKNGGVAFLTGTPISNSLVEIYSVMKYLIPKSMKAMGIAHFDAWKASFIQDQTRFEYTASMQLKERNVMAGMINLGPLAQLYRSFADIVMRPEVERMYREQMEAKNAAEKDPSKHVSTRFPTPKVKGGGRRIDLAPPTQKMTEFVRYLVMRMAGIQRNKSDKEYPKVDNPLWVLSDARKASVDIRTIDPTLGREEGAKVTRAADQIMRNYKANTERRGTQLVFCDMSTPSKSAEKEAKRIIREASGLLDIKGAKLKETLAQSADKSFASQWADLVDQLDATTSSPATSDKKRDQIEQWINGAGQDAPAAMFTADTGFSFYDDLRSILIDRGIPEKEIAFIHDYNTTPKKKDLFEKVNEGQVRVLIGSTQKMGAGTNAQKRLVALHHIDAPWRPSDMEQREGRIIRQGNMFYEADPDGFEVEITAYSTEKTADVVQWQILERKAKGIETFLNAATDKLEEDSGDADQYAQFMAQSTGKRIFLDKMTAEKERDTARAEIANDLRSEAEARNFLDAFDRNQKVRREAIATYGPVTKMAGPKGSDTYLADWKGKIAAYFAAREKNDAEAEAIRARNKDKPRKEWEKLPPKPEAPKRWQERPSNPYEASVYDTLSKLQRAAHNGQAEISIPYGNGAEIHVFARGDGSDLVAYSVALGANADVAGFDLHDGMSVAAKDFRNSDKLLSSFDPENISYRAGNLVSANERALSRSAELRQQMEAIIAKGVDRSKVERAEQRVAELSALARVEEVKFAQETANAGPNHFALLDDKGRSLVNDDGAKPITGQFQFQLAGRQYSSEWGAPAANRERIEGSDQFGQVGYFEAEDMDSHEPVIVKAIKHEGKDGGPERWEPLDVFDQPTEGEPDAKYQRDMDQEPVARLTGDELGEWSDIRQLGKKAYAWYRENLTDKTVTNAETGWQIGFDGVGAKKVSGRKGDVLYRLVPAIEQILQKGRLVSSENDKRARQEILAIHKFSADVKMGGQTYSVIATVRQKRDGTYHYDLSMDRGASGFSTATAQDKNSRASALEGDPAPINLEIADEKVKMLPRERVEMRRISHDLNRLAAEVGISGKVTATAVRGLFDAAGTPIRGRYHAGRVEIDADAADRARVMDHEIIHALRDAKLWDRPYGLFTRAEWQTLIAAARQRDDLRKRVAQAYPDLSQSNQLEEVIAEMYAEHGDKARTDNSVLGRALGKVRAFLRAIATVLRAHSAPNAATIFDTIRGGAFTPRAAPTDVQSAPGRFANAQPYSDSEIAKEARRLPPSLSTLPPFKGRSMLAARKHFVRYAMTNAMDGAGGFSSLSLIPGRALIAEMGRNIPAAQTYLALKEKMDTLRNEMHEKYSKTTQEWRKLTKLGKENMTALMDLMHDATIEGIDPSLPFIAKSEPRDPWLVNRYGLQSKTGKEASERIASDETRRSGYALLKKRFDALPKEFQTLFSRVRRDYEHLNSDFQEAVEYNAKKAMEYSVKRAEREHAKMIDQIARDGLTGRAKAEALAEADAMLKSAQMRGEWGKAGRIRELRAKFESNKLEGPYFPLARFGNFFVTARDKDGQVVSFSKFENEKDQAAEAKALRAEGYEVQTGVMSPKTSREMVDPSFVADVEQMLSGSGVGDDILDAIWQRWLQSLPDFSVRKSKIHRKATAGYSGDAMRAYASHMFHGSHQLARLRYAVDMQEALENAENEAAQSDDPNRSGLVVREIRLRHDFVMNPKGSKLGQRMTTGAFIYFLGASPSAAAVNLTQTTVVGIPVLAAFHGKKTGFAVAARELNRAMGDFVRGKGHAGKSSRLNSNEKQALKEAYDLGTIDKSQSHDLMGISDAGIEYRPARAAVMEKISYLFHHAERLNREVTFLAAYRMARDKGFDHTTAVEKAADLTWKTHFDYQNSSRPRIMQNDFVRVAAVFRNFNVNMLWRLFRDMHQMVKGESPEIRREARYQLIGITGSLFLHAGIRGVWGYGLLTALLGFFFDDGKDELEQDIQRTLVETLGHDAAGMILNGVPGHLLGIDLTNRIGMPDLWFRSPNRILEGQDAYEYWVTQALGATFAIGGNVARGWDQVMNGDIMRGLETMSPKVINDMFQAARFAREGALNRNGDAIMDHFSVPETLAVLLGFTPARLTEQYEKNSTMKRMETRIQDRRGNILREVRTALLDRKPITDKMRKAIADFNEHAPPSYRIDGSTIRRSLKARIASSRNSKGGIYISPSLRGFIDRELAPDIYGSE
ncbi:hypothetical protein DL1_08435 [Thioclava dalianensis]|uniref:Helicase ATP-binding domain-containing protein n=1 Tax=Thioclava dalianensis TaxID=1185766 RepID=A0A074TF91_9RHOB|nr:PLxRFG domain-containing protein [Thioclava dalianensis]KEP68805.1 hypothetical protein DL1_08435 [Thioclava dalianensis]SFN50469.1 Helicase conserved C-terminal domain-containing protein [Thioclava dalianensis]